MHVAQIPIKALHTQELRVHYISLDTIQLNASCNLEITMSATCYV